MTGVDVTGNLPGYHGCYLRIDLTKGSSDRITLDEKFLRSCLGGSGLGVALLLREGVAAVDPTSPPPHSLSSSVRWWEVR